MKSNNPSDQSLDLALLRIGRNKRNIRIPKTMGDYIDSLEAKLNELQLQTSMIIDQTSIERQKSEILAHQIVLQIKTAEDQILKFLNDYQRDIFDKIYAQVKVSESDLKFKGTDIYDMSFISNFDYSKVKIYNDKTLLQSRPDNREVFRYEMYRYKQEADFAQGLITATDTKVDLNMLPELYNQRNYFIREYYLSAIKFYQECTIIGFLHNPTNNLENLKEFISLNDENIPALKKSLEYKRLSLGEIEYKNQIDLLDYRERMLVTAKARLKYLMQAYEGKWTPPTFDTLKEYANKNNLTYSRVVYELNEQSRQTLCVPDWIIGIAEMYNVIQKQQEPMTELNPYDSRWIRKAKEVINLESEGVNYTAQKLFKAISEYWTVLTMGISELEDYHLEAVMTKALAEDSSPITGYVITNDFTLIDFSEDINVINKFTSATAKQLTPMIDDNRGLAGLQAKSEKFNRERLAKKGEAFFGYNDLDNSLAMGGLFSKVWRGITKAVSQTIKVAQKITGVVAKAVKQSLDNTLGRVLPKSIYDKISNFTDGALAIMSLHLDKKEFRKIVEGVTDIYLIGLRINNEAFRVADRHGVLKGLDKYSGGLCTSYMNLSSTPIKLRNNEKIDWKVVLIDAIKVGLAVYAGASLVATQTTTNLVGEETGLNKTSLGKGLLSAGAMIATGQSSFTNELAKGATTTGTKAVINNTSLGQSSVGRTVAEIGIASTVTSIQANEAFSQTMRDKAEDKAKQVAKKEADKVLKANSGGLLTVDVINSVSTDVYQFATGEKSLGDILQETKDHYASEVSKMGDKLDSVTEEKIANESDRYLKKKLDDAYGHTLKYGEDKLVTYLMKKYGPREEYDSVIVPDDYLNYQIDNTGNNDRIFNVVYKSNFALKAGLLIGAGVIFSSFLIQDS